MAAIFIIGINFLEPRITTTLYHKERPAVGVMAMSDSHVVDCGSSPEPGGLNSCWVCLRACLRSREENGGEGTAAWPSALGGDFSLSVSVSQASARAL